MTVRQLWAALAAAVLVPLIAIPTPTPAAATTAPAHRPVVFVHGFAGSGSQFETQAKRLATNGYPAEFIEAHEYDSTAIATVLPQVWSALDARITRLLTTTGADRVDLLGHSLGTFVIQGYLNSSPQRAARVAHYVNLDGAQAAAPPGAVPTLAVWGEGDPTRTIPGALNTYFPHQSHTQTVTSPETFTEIYKFFHDGRPPHTTRILPAPTLLSGRAVLFPTNTGLTDARLEVYEVTPLTGHRHHPNPTQVLTLSPDGSFGPFPANPHTRYEFAIVFPSGHTHHIYFQPFTRTDRLIRLLTSRPGEGLSALMPTTPHHTNLTVNRNKEWWGDQPESGDTLLINGRNILNPATAPRTKRVIGMFAFDHLADTQTNLTAPIPEFFAQPFITGMDVFIPTRPRVVSVLARPRASNGLWENLSVPAWPSTTHRVSLNFNDYPRFQFPN
ncbi:MAG TPA: hypothetical protein VFV67_18785 [Actinophytocola sp.]|uniref:hypothetical protein n=1 Tax=Actinophytocola sp. TaxID=1872138 RepID=UPI002DBC00B2|nr:hypothetical protein [Actinophytocola sp.]HEU5472698.1 hypothetical protein [Actinophytocola sp.]